MPETWIAVARIDLLRGLTPRQRLDREEADARFIKERLQIYAQPEAMAVAKMSFAGVSTSAISAKDLKPYDPSITPDVVVCARLDLDHPLYFRNNLIGNCADCACDVQYRPHAPAGLRLCICCTAQRVREQGEATKPAAPR